jgi:single-strand DNA-binding protein
MLRTIMTGRVGQDAEARQVGEQYAISFSIVHSESWKDKDGNKVEVPYWIKCTKWMKTDKLAQFINKGDIVSITGLPSSEAWIDKATGEAKSQVIMNVRDLTFEWSSRSNVPESSTPQNPKDTGAAPNDDLPF